MVMVMEGVGCCVNSVVNNAKMKSCSNKISASVGISILLLILISEHVTRLV